eukprot:c43847_g1_i1 orf=53-208(-)
MFWCIHMHSLCYFPMMQASYASDISNKAGKSSTIQNFKSLQQQRQQANKAN